MLKRRIPWDKQPSFPGDISPGFRWDVLINQAFPHVNSARRNAITPRGSMLVGKGGVGRNWYGANCLEQITVPLPTTSTGYTILWVGPMNVSNTGTPVSVLRITGGGFRFEPYTTFGGAFVTFAHTGVAGTTPPFSSGVSWDHRNDAWVYMATYDGTTVWQALLTPNGAYEETTNTVGMNAGTGTLDLSTSSGSFGAYLVGYAQRPMDIALRRKIMRLPWSVYEKTVYEIQPDGGGGGGSVNLTGQAVTASRGILVPVNAIILNGQVITSARGTLVPALARTLTGQAVTINRGALTPSIGNVVALSGLAVTLSRGTLIPATAVPLTGQAVTASRGTLVPLIGNGVVLSGQALTVSTGSLKANLAIGLLGQAITSSRGTLTPSVGGNVSVNLTGSSVTISRGTLGTSLGDPPETITFSWSKEGAVFTFRKNTTLFEFD